MNYYPDYNLIDEIQQRNEKAAKDYVMECPHLLDLIQFARDNASWYDTTRAAEMERIKLDPARGLVTLLDGSSYTCDEVWGDITRP